MEGNKAISVAYADDHKVVRKGIVSILSEFNTISIDIEADNGKELIEKIEKVEQLPDICIIDISMPVMNGFQTQMELHKRWPSIKTLVLTAYDIELYIIKMIVNGANGYLLKNCDPREIEQALISIKTTGVYHSEISTSHLFHAVKSREIILPNFTEKEMQVLKYCCSDLSYSQIADQMNTTRRSVEGYRDSLFKKLGVNSRTMLALYAVQFGIVSLEINANNTNIY
jgi:two-component system, NarL family, invasion response regulator UvrY